MKLKIAYSPCPNDTFIFHGLASGAAGDDSFDVTLADVEVLNGMAARGEPDVCKVSVAAAAGLLDEYVLLRCGGAMGRGVGPVLVAKPGVKAADLAGAPVAVPGFKTTANLLFRAYCADAGISPQLSALVFDEVMPAIQRDEILAGVVIHEGRFTFGQYGLERVADLGGWWEQKTGMPIPLGAIVVRRSLGAEVHRRVAAAIRKSLRSAWDGAEGVMDYVRQHAQEMDQTVIDEHIRTFVTDYSMDVGDEGEDAVAFLLKQAAEAEGFALPDAPVFFSDAE